MPATDWTPEQLDNATKYGLCRICREPREASIVHLNNTGVARHVGDPEIVTEYRLVCPNGHPQ